MFGNSLTKMKLPKNQNHGPWSMVHYQITDTNADSKFNLIRRASNTKSLKKSVAWRMLESDHKKARAHRHTHTHHSTLSTSHNPVFPSHVSAWLYPVPLANSTLCTGVHEAASQKNNLQSGLTNPFTPCLERTADGVQFFLFRLCVHTAKCQGG